MRMNIGNLNLNYESVIDLSIENLYLDFLYSFSFWIKLSNADLTSNFKPCYVTQIPLSNALYLIIFSIIFYVINLICC